ncbi:hypothetical protein AMS68_005684 [Peltaster fructicola]|uniref:Uncharacterized protein n=1 Tax=Peltaster fructicola TaxID=286661 RepID=A0A6H0XZI7_9PEZI|nr:hypothetical protein AMS68_005684 [Peltaster fructicola]
MQCRNALRRHVNSNIAPKSSATATPYRWITEEQLNEAFARFVRVSKSSRRFGSNVPGPLEARRRQARRRMGFLGADACQGTGLAEFGALFGAGEQRTGVYEWQPPNHRKEATNEHIATHGSRGAWTASSPGQEAWARQPSVPVLEEPLLWNESEVNASAAHEIHDDREQIFTSQCTFADLLRSHEHSKRFTAADIAPLLDFLQSDQDAPRARNLATLLRWLQQQSISASVFTAVRDLIISKHRLKTISLSEFKATLEPLCSLAMGMLDVESKTAYHKTLIMLSDHIIHCCIAESSAGQRLKVVYRSLLRAIIPQKSSYESLADSLEALSVLANERHKIDLSGSFIAQAIKDLLLRIPQYRDNANISQYTLIRDAFAQILNDCREARMAPTVMHLLLNDAGLAKEKPKIEARSFTRMRKLASFWLKCLHQSNRLSSRTPRDELVENWATYWVAGRVYSPLELAEVLVQLKPVQMASAFMFGWTARYDRANDSTSPNLVSTRTQISSGTAQLSQQVQPSEAEHSIIFRRVSYSKKNDKFALGDLQKALFEEFNYTQMSSIQDPRITLLLAMKQHQYCEELLLVDLIKIFIRGKYHFSRINELYKAIKEYKLSMPVQLQAALVNHLLRLGYSRRALDIMLDSPDLPLSKIRDLPSTLLSDSDPAWILTTISEKLDVSTTPQNVADLVSELATCVASAEHYTASRAYDRVWRCYNFLAMRHIKMDACISRAMVRSGIIRALETRSTLPDTRLEYILDKVRWYEGDVTADKLEEYAKLERQKTPSYRQAPTVFRPEIEDKHRYRLSLMPRF